MIPSCLRSNPESKWDAIAEALCFNESRGSALKNAIKMVVFSVARIVSYILKGEENYFKDLISLFDKPIVDGDCVSS